MNQQAGERVCVGAVLVRWVDHRGYRSPLVLLGKRGVERAYYLGVWDVLGGHLEPGETVEQALARDPGEEAGVTPTAWWSLSEFREPPPTAMGFWSCTSTPRPTGPAFRATAHQKSTPRSPDFQSRTPAASPGLPGDPA
jgi:8-oxo-dGTP pyrophosphatase MutT (NUDIX family)